MNFAPDFKWDNCQQIIAYGLSYTLLGIAENSNALYSIFPSDFEQYWKEIRGNARTDWRKAVKHGCTIKRIYKVEGVVNKEIIEIWDSVDTRQGRPINRNLVDVECKVHPISDKWPIPDYSMYKCPNHSLEFWIVTLNKKIVAYIELVTCGDMAMVHSLLGHFDFLKYGIMKYLFIEIGRECIRRGIKYFFYAFEPNLEKDLRFFLRDLRITNVLRPTNLDPRLIEQLRGAGYGIHPTILERQV